MSTPTIHKRQLFHGIGRHIEQDKLLTEADRVSAYVDALRGSLADGLWLNRMDEVLRLRKEEYTLARRMVYFTENRLSECRFHSMRYGRLGLGFPKRFVLEAGGKPVSYVHHKTGDLYTLRLLEALRLVDGTPANDPLDFVAHFVKPLGVKRESAARDKTAQTRKAAATRLRRRETRVPRIPPGPPDAHLMRRRFGPRMLHQSEGEWRVVEDARLLSRTGVTFKPSDRRTYLKYEVGADLMTIVFPDSRIQHAALQDRDVARALKKGTPPVNIYHLDEIGEL